MKKTKITSVLPRGTIFIVSVIIGFILLFVALPLFRSFLFAVFPSIIYTTGIYLLVFKYVSYVIIYLFFVFGIYLSLEKLIVHWLTSRSQQQMIDILEVNDAVNKTNKIYNQELELAQQDFVKLSSYMAHEQKNILAILRAKVQLNGDEELLREVDRVTVAIDDVLTMSASEHMLKDQLLDLSFICADIIDEYQKVYTNIFFHFSEEAEYIVKGRELWIRRAISNLIENAIKYGEDGQITVGLQQKNGSVVLSVQDEGTGLDESEQKKIFENFYRMNGLKKDGYGIGLGLVKHVCNLCNGFFWVENVAPRGAKFYIVLSDSSIDDKTGELVIII